MRCERYRKERDGALDEVDYLRKQLHKARRDENMARLRDKGQCVSKTAAAWRSSARSFYVQMYVEFIFCSLKELVKCLVSKCQVFVVIFRL